MAKVPPASPDVEAGPGPTDTQLKKIVQLARDQYKLLKDIDTAQKALDQLNLLLKQNSEVDLPAAMDEIGMKNYALSNGASVEIETNVQASIAEVNRPAAHKWLEAHKMGDLIKREIKILFGKDQVSWAKKFLADCAKRTKPLNLKTKEWVDPQTLKATVRGLRRDAEAAGKNPDEVVPKDLFGVYVARFAVVTLHDEEPAPKPKKSK